MNNGN